MVADMITFWSSCLAISDWCIVAPKLPELRAAPLAGRPLEQMENVSEAHNYPGHSHTSQQSIIGHNLLVSTTNRQSGEA